MKRTQPTQQQPERKRRRKSAELETLASGSSDDSGTSPPLQYISRGYDAMGIVNNMGILRSLFDSLSDMDIIEAMDELNETFSLNNEMEQLSERFKEIAARRGFSSQLSPVVGNFLIEILDSTAVEQHLIGQTGLTTTTTTTTTTTSSTGTTAHDTTPTAAARQETECFLDFKKSLKKLMDLPLSKNIQDAAPILLKVTESFVKLCNWPQDELKAVREQRLYDISAMFASLSVYWRNKDHVHDLSELDSTGEIWHCFYAFFTLNLHMTSLRRFQSYADSELPETIYNEKIRGILHALKPDYSFTLKDKPLLLWENKPILRSTSADAHPDFLKVVVQSRYALSCLVREYGHSKIIDDFRVLAILATKEDLFFMQMGAVVERDEQKLEYFPKHYTLSVDKFSLSTIDGISQVVALLGILASQQIEVLTKLLALPFNSRYTSLGTGGKKKLEKIPLNTQLTIKMLEEPIGEEYKICGHIRSSNPSRRSVLYELEKIDSSTHKPKNPLPNRLILKPCNSNENMAHYLWKTSYSSLVVELYDPMEIKFNVEDASRPDNYLLLPKLNSFKDWAKDKDLKELEKEFIALSRAFIDGPVQKGFIHGDVKPSNMYWNEETRQVQLSDFEFGARTNTSVMGGTDHYMDPAISGKKHQLWRRVSDLNPLAMSFLEVMENKGTISDKVQKCMKAMRSEKDVSVAQIGQLLKDAEQAAKEK